MKLSVTNASLAALMVRAASGETIDDEPFWASFRSQVFESMPSITADPTSAPIEPIPDEPSSEPTSAPSLPICDSIETIVCSVPEFSILCDLIDSTGLRAPLDEGTFTIFAPVNDAFESISAELANAASDVEVLTNVLLYHTVADVKLLAENLDCDGGLLMTTLEETTTICIGNDIFQVGSGNSPDSLPKIIAADGMACNGIIHAIDQVLVPTIASPTEFPSASPSASPVATAATAAPTVTASSTPTATASAFPSASPSASPVATAATAAPTIASSSSPTATASAVPSPSPSASPIEASSSAPTATASAFPSPSPSASPTIASSSSPTATASAVPSPSPSASPIEASSSAPTATASAVPSPSPSDSAVEASSAPSPSPSDSALETMAPTITEQCESIAQVVCTLPEFEILCALVRDVDLVGILSSFDEVTVFAPTNQAFESLPMEFADAVINDPELLRTVLLTHVYPGKLFSTSLECDMEISMASGQETTTVCMGDMIFQAGAGNPSGALPEIILFDGVACNGVIHAIDLVILPG